MSGNSNQARGSGRGTDPGAPGVTALGLLADTKRRRVLEALRSEGEMVLSDLALRADIRNSTLSDLVPELVASGLVGREDLGSRRDGVLVQLLLPGRELLTLGEHAQRVRRSAAARVRRRVLPSDGFSWLAPLTRPAALDVLAAVDQVSNAAAVQRRLDGVSKHQVRERLRDLADGGFIERTGHRPRRFRIHDSGRTAAVYVVLGAHFEVLHRIPGATAPRSTDLTKVMGVVAPLLEIDPGLEGICELVVTDPEPESCVLHVEGGGATLAQAPGVTVDAVVEGTIDNWCAALLRGRRGRLQLRGNERLGRAVARALHDDLPWR